MLSKSVIFISILIFSLADVSVFAQDHELIRVHRVDGVEAYFMSEPLRDYEVVLDKSGGIQGGSFFTGGLINASISEKASKFVKRIRREAEYEGKTIDAVIYDSGKRAIGVRWTDQPSLATKGIGRVNKLAGVGIFILGEPLSDYKVLVSRKGGLRFKSAITGGLINNSIEEDINKFVNRLRKKDQSLEGVVYSAGKSAISIRFK